MSHVEKATGNPHSNYDSLQAYISANVPNSDFTENPVALAFSIVVKNAVANAATITVMNNGKALSGPNPHPFLSNPSPANKVLLEQYAEAAMNVALKIGVEKEERVKWRNAIDGIGSALIAAGHTNNHADTLAVKLGIDAGLKAELAKLGISPEQTIGR